MNAEVSSDLRITTLEVTDDLFIAQLADGRTISVPLAWSWRLSNATPEAASELRDYRDGTRRALAGR